ncbi:MAG: hypothetical protein KF901_28800 [Myxococcales bacterium]|nr:hypothetical protein [Myxococcales bacterium]
MVVSADGDVSATLDVEVRVGRYALSGDDVALSRASFFIGETPAVDFVLSRPDDFGRVEPGERVRVEVSGAAAATAFPSAREVLCAAAEATALVTWTAREQPDDPLDPPLMSFGSSEGTVAVRCD